MKATVLSLLSCIFVMFFTQRFRLYMFYLFPLSEPYNPPSWWTNALIAQNLRGELMRKICAASWISLLLRRFVFRMAEASAKRGDEPQGTMGRVQTAGEAPARSCVVFLAKKSFSWHGPIFGLFKSWKRSILVAYCCKHCKLWVDRWIAQNFQNLR